jgi:hypothetical protein
MTLKEFRERLDELLEAAEKDDLPSIELLTALEEWAEVERGDLIRIERIGRRARRLQD